MMGPPSPSRAASPIVLRKGGASPLPDLSAAGSAPRKELRPRRLRWRRRPARPCLASLASSPRCSMGGEGPPHHRREAASRPRHHREAASRSCRRASTRASCHHVVPHVQPPRHTSRREPGAIVVVGPREGGEEERLLGEGERIRERMRDRVSGILIYSWADYQPKLGWLGLGLFRSGLCRLCASKYRF